MYQVIEPAQVTPDQQRCFQQRWLETSRTRNLGSFPGSGSGQCLLCRGHDSGQAAVRQELHQSRKRLTGGDVYGGLHDDLPAQLKVTVRPARSTVLTCHPAPHHALACTWRPSGSLAHHAR
jgi:hypothetical protein